MQHFAVANRNPSQCTHFIHPTHCQEYETETKPFLSPLFSLFLLSPFVQNPASVYCTSCTQSAKRIYLDSTVNVLPAIKDQHVVYFNYRVYTLSPVAMYPNTSTMTMRPQMPNTNLQVGKKNPGSTRNSI